MNAFAAWQVDAAIARLPVQASAAIATVRASALSHRLAALVAACDAELARRPFAFSAVQATTFAAQQAAVAGMSLAEAIAHAFTVARKPSAEETRFLGWLAANPNGSFAEAKAAYGKGDLNLLIGHLVYHRLGCFRPFLPDGATQSSVLLDVDRSGKSVRYRLRPEAEAVLRGLAIIPA